RGRAPVPGPGPWTGAGRRAPGPAAPLRTLPGAFDTCGASFHLFGSRGRAPTCPPGVTVHWAQKGRGPGASSARLCPLPRAPWLPGRGSVARPLRPRGLLILPRLRLLLLRLGRRPLGRHDRVRLAFVQGGLALLALLGQEEDDPGQLLAVVDRERVLGRLLDRQRGGHHRVGLVRADGQR